MNWRDLTPGQTLLPISSLGSPYVLLSKDPAGNTTWLRLDTGEPFEVSPEGLPGEVDPLYEALGPGEGGR